MCQSLLSVTNVTGHFFQVKHLNFCFHTTIWNMEARVKQNVSAMALFLIIVTSGPTFDLLFLIIVILYLTV